MRFILRGEFSFCDLYSPSQNDLFEILLFAPWNLKDGTPQPGDTHFQFWKHLSLSASKVKSWTLSVTFQQNLLWTRLKVPWSNQTALFLRSHHHQQHLCRNHLMYITCITSHHHQQYLHHNHKILISKSFCLVSANQVPMLLLVTQAVPGPPRVPTVWPHNSFRCLRCWTTSRC